MKILILANNDGGLYKFRKSFIQELLKEHQVIISLPYGNLVEPLKNMGCDFIEMSIERRGMNPIKDFRLLKSYRKFIKKIKPDLVITYTIKPNIYGGMVCRTMGIPYVVNITGLGTAFQSNGALRKFITVLYRYSLKKADTVFFENKENREVFLKTGIVRESQAYLLHGAGVDLEYFQTIAYPSEQFPTRFLFIGRVMKEKGIDELFEAIHRLRKDGISCELDILGGFEEDYQEKITKYEAEGWLHYHGYQDDVRPFIAKSHCFVLPSWHEGMANTNLECAASGRPLITSRIHGCMEAVIEHVSGFLCEKQNANSLYQVMKMFTELPEEERRQMGLAGRKHMEDVFDKKAVVQETMQRLMR